MITKKLSTPRLVVLIILVIIAGIAAWIITIPNRMYKGEILRDEKITVELTSSTDVQQLAFENDFVKVTVGCDQFLTYLNQEINDKSASEI